MPDNQQFTADHGETFHADQITIMHGEGKVILDFKTTAPRFDQYEGESQHVVVTEHAPVTLSPENAKILLTLLQENLENYEEKFGEIEIPEREEPEDLDAEEGAGYIG